MWTHKSCWSGGGKQNRNKWNWEKLRKKLKNSEQKKTQKQGQWLLNFLEWSQINVSILNKILLSWKKKHLPLQWWMLKCVSLTFHSDDSDSEIAMRIPDVIKGIKVKIIKTKGIKVKIIKIKVKGSWEIENASAQRSKVKIKSQTFKCHKRSKCVEQDLAGHLLGQIGLGHKGLGVHCRFIATCSKNIQYTTALELHFDFAHISISTFAVFLQPRMCSAFQKNRKWRQQR